MGCAPQDPQSSSVTTTFGPDTFKLPELGFAFDALAPAIDAATMEIPMESTMQDTCAS